MKRKILILITALTSMVGFSQTINLEDLDVHSDSKIYEKNNMLWYWDYSHTALPLTSSDQGETWETVVPNIVLASQSETILFQDKFYSIGGIVNSNRTSRVDYSTDGVNWTSYTAPFPARRQHGVFIHNNRLHVIGGEGNSVTHKDIWSTDDGLNWTQVTNAIIPTTSVFYTPRATSVNGKIVIFGGQESEFGGQNHDKVFVSDDNGQTFNSFIFPYSTSLDDGSTFFVFDEKLWVHQYIRRYHMNNEADNISLTEGRFYTTNDGETWNIESEINSTLGKEYFYVDQINDQIIKFTETGFGSTTTTKSMFKITELEVPEIASFIANQNQSIINIPFQVNNSMGDLDYCVTSSNEAILTPHDITFAGNQMTISPNTVTGETMISVKVSDDVNTEYVDFWFFNFPGEKVALSNFKNRRFDIGENVENRGVNVSFLDGYGTNSFSFTSTNSTLVNENEMNVININPIFNINTLSLGSSFNTSNPGEVQLSVTATDGNFSSTSTFWVKVGNDEAPIANNTLADYIYDGIDFNYQLPTTSFTESEGQELIYSSPDLPCGLRINPETGEITGNIDFTEDFTITIVATDRYYQWAEHILNVINNSVLSLKENTAVNHSVSIYPNPSTDYLMIKSENEINRVNIYSLSGQLILEFNVQSNELELSHSLPKGVYFIEVKDSNFSAINKVLIN